MGSTALLRPLPAIALLFGIFQLLAAEAFAFTTIENEPPVYGVEAPASPVPEPTLPDELADTENNPPPPPRQQERLIYLTIEDIPQKLYVGQIFPVTVKITSLRRHVPYTISLEGGRNVKKVEGPSAMPPRAISHVTLYFQALGNPVVLPDIVVRYEESDTPYTLEGVTLTAVRLNPPRHFSGLLAKDLRLVNYQASAYDENRNILSLELLVSYGNVDDFRLPGALKQGIDAKEGDINATTLRYYGVFGTDTEEVVFSYFNLPKNRYDTFRVPVIVKRSSVSTQTNLDPQASEFTKFKIAATGAMIFIWAILWWRRRGWLYPLLIMLATAYLLTYLIPLKSVCLRSGATVYLLPTPQSTPFTRLPERTEAKEMERRDGYTKVQFPNNRIGWVKHEDLCQN
ncbi:hypothetical protein [Hydrogenimonas sp.]